MNVLHLNKESFEKLTSQTGKAVLVDFWATWCGPCKMIAPVIEEIARENSDIKVCKVDVDNEPELANAFSIMSIPTLVVMKNGKVTTFGAGGCKCSDFSIFVSKCGNIIVVVLVTTVFAFV